MQSYRRLPHIYPEGRWLFVTFNLHRAIPPGRFPPAHKTSGEAFVWIDQYLDRTRFGRRFLQRDEIAEIVATSLFNGVELCHYELAAFVIMPNHVHVLLLPLMPLPRLMKSLKGYTAYAANKVLHRTGEPFWQRESYDHWVRDETEFGKIVRYIERNPVKAELAGAPEEYLWSSANPRFRETLERVRMSADTAR